MSLREAILDRSIGFQIFNQMIGAGQLREEFVRISICPQVGHKILDIGCGTGDLLHYLPPCDYYGFDLNPNYIAYAKRRYGARGVFECQELSRSALLRRDFDIVIAGGVLHHLSDEQCDVLTDLAFSALKEGGKLVTLDGCFVREQSRMARFFVSRDRGRFVRNPERYLEILKRRFKVITHEVRFSMLRLPYTHFISQCHKGST